MTYTTTKHFFISVAVVLCALLAMPFFASALTITVPTVTVSTGEIVRNSTGLSARFGTNRNNEAGDQNENGATVEGAQQGQDGEDGEGGEQGGTVITGNENTQVTIVNNGPTAPENNSNGGATAGSGGSGGRGLRGGAIRAGGVTTSSSSTNSVNSTLNIVIPGLQ